MRGTFRKRGSKWYFQVEWRDPETGKRIQKAKGGFRTKKDAEVACAEFIAKLERGEYLEPKKVTVAEFLTFWLQHYAKVNMRLSTYSNRELLIQRRIIPVIGGIELEKLSPVVITKFYNKLRSEGLSGNYIHSIHALLRSAMRKAVQWQFIQKNPMDSVDSPKLSPNRVQTWTPEDVRKFLSTNQDNPAYIGFLLAIYTGMRRGEVLGLRWEDVDLENGKLFVRQTLYWTPQNGILFQEPKTKTAQRQIALPEAAICALQTHKIKQDELRRMLGPSYHDHDLVCCREDGQPFTPRSFLKQFERAVQKAGVPKVRFHDLRHTHATLLLLLGENPKVVSERLGHSRVGITLDVYSHVLPDMQRAAAEKIERILREG